MTPFLAMLLAAASPAGAERADERELMVLSIANLAAGAGPRGHRAIEPSVLAAMRKVPRHLFVPEGIRAEAYENRALPIGHGATISQPYIVALMTDLLDVQPGQEVLEVGTGSGYQAAVLAELGAEVKTIEIVEPLAAEASERLRTLGYEKVEVRAGDGYAGWPDAAPFDRIIVTAGADHVPNPLVEQLRPGGRMVIPVGSGPEGLQLSVIEKAADGRVRRKPLLPVRFVPLVRER